MESKSFQRFRSKVKYINQNLQIFDASLKVLSEKLKAETDETKPISKSLKLSAKIYSELNQPVKEKYRLVAILVPKWLNTQYWNCLAHLQFICVI